MKSVYFVIFCAVIQGVLTNNETEPNSSASHYAEGRATNNCPVPDDDEDFIHDTKCGDRQGPIYITDSQEEDVKYICRCLNAYNQDATGWYRYGDKWPQSTTEDYDY